MSAGSLLAAGRSFLAMQFPATIRLGGVVIENVATSGLHSEPVLTEHGLERTWRISFWIDLAVLATLNLPLPKARETPLEWQKNADVAVWTLLELQAVVQDPAGATIALTCSQS